MTSSTYDQKRARTRQALLDAGAELLGGALLDGLAHSLGPVAVARHANISRQTWYRYWPGAADFLTELLTQRLEELRIEDVQFALENTVTGEFGPMTERIRAAARARIDRRREPAHALPVLLAGALLASGADVDGALAPIEDAFAGYHHEHEEQGRRVIGALLASSRRMPTPQLGLERLVAMLNALTDGIVLRSYTDPDLYGSRLFADALVLLLPALSVPDPMLAPAFAELVDAPTPPAATAQQRVARRRRERTRAEVLTVARSEFSANGYQQTTIGAISAASGVSETTIFEHFGSKAGIAAAAFAPAIGGLSNHLADEADLPVLTRIRNHLLRLSAILHRSPAFVAAYFDVGAYVVAPGRPVDRRDPRILAPVETPLVPLVEEAQREGLVVDRLPSRQLAGGITILMLTRVFGFPQEDPETTTEAVEVLALHGALTDGARRHAPG
jgi:AcrR family transcriptional regulator